MSRTREWLVGVNSVRGVLENDADHVEELVLDGSSTNRRVNELLELAQQAAIPVRTSKKSRLDQLSEGRPHQGVAARYRAPGVLTLAQLEELIARDSQSTLLLMLRLTLSLPFYVGMLLYLFLTTEMVLHFTSAVVDSESPARVRQVMSLRSGTDPIGQALDRH